MHAGTAETEPCPGLSEAEVHEHPGCTDPTAPPPRRLVCDRDPGQSLNLVQEQQRAGSAIQGLQSAIEARHGR
jgi:hypothetical protein